MLYLHYGLSGTRKTVHVQQGIRKSMSKSEEGKGSEMNKIFAIGKTEQWRSLSWHTMNYLNFLRISSNVTAYAGCVFVFDNFEALRNFDIQARSVLLSLIDVLAVKNTVHVISNDLDLLLTCAPINHADKYYYHYIDYKNNRKYYYHKSFNSNNLFGFKKFIIDSQG